MAALLRDARLVFAGAGGERRHGRAVPQRRGGGRGGGERQDGGIPQRGGRGSAGLRHRKAASGGGVGRAAGEPRVEQRQRPQRQLRRRSGPRPVSPGPGLHSRDGAAGHLRRRVPSVGPGVLGTVPHDGTAHRGVPLQRQGLVFPAAEPDGRHVPRHTGHRRRGGTQPVPRLCGRRVHGRAGGPCGALPASGWGKDPVHRRGSGRL